jgi:integrase
VDISGKIAQANGRLKDGRVGCSIYLKGDRLYLRATLPPRPGSQQQRPHQQRIALHYHANAAGVQLAEKEARKVGALLDCGEFDWQPYLGDRPAEQNTIGHWVEKFAAAHQRSISSTSWKTEYKNVFSTLDSEQPLSVEALTAAIDEVEKDSRQRRRFCVSLGKLARFAGLEVDFTPLQGKYSSRSVDPRTIPTDETIALWFKQMAPSWRWVYGVMAVYGLRNHEAFFLDTAELERGGWFVTVLQGKTGGRTVWPCYPEWIEVFKLRSPVLPEVSGQSHADYGHRLTQMFRRRAVPFRPYDLRHAWAVRTMRFGLHDALAAQQMGHSRQVHSNIYHHWISQNEHQRAFEALMLRSDRPLPPLIH